MNVGIWKTRSRDRYATDIWRSSEGEEDGWTPIDKAEDKITTDLIKNIVTFFGGHDIDGGSKRARSEYTRQTKYPPEYIVNRADTGPPCAYLGQDGDIVFTKKDLRCVINPYNDTLVIIAQIANKNLYKVLVDTGHHVTFSNTRF